MRILGRLTLLSLFAATGVAVALYVGFSIPLRSHGQPPGHSAGQCLTGTTGAPCGAWSPGTDRAPCEAWSVGPPASEPAGTNLRLVPVEGVSRAEPGGQEDSGKEVTRMPAREAIPQAFSAASGLRTSPEASETRTLDSGSVQLTLSLPPGPVVAEPHPARTFQVRSGEQSPGLLTTFRFWKSLATPLFSQVARDSGQSAQDPAPLPAPAEPGDVVLADPPGSSAKAVVGEGDNELSMQFPNNDIREVLDALSIQGNLKILATESVQGKVSATLTGVDVESALDAILKSTGYVARRDGEFIYVGKPEDFEALEKSLDRIVTRVYRPNYVTAAELETLIQPLVTTGLGVVSVSSPAEVGITADSASAGWLPIEANTPSRVTVPRLPPVERVSESVE